MFNSEYEQAKATMANLEEISSSMSVGETQYMFVESPVNWMFVSPYSNQPNKLCYCKSDIGLWGERFSRHETLNSKVLDSCNKKGACFDVKSIVSVPSSCYGGVANCARLLRAPMMMRIEKTSKDKTTFVLQGYYSDRDALLNDFGKICYYLGFSSIFSEMASREAFDLPADVAAIESIELEGNVDVSCAEKLKDSEDCLFGNSAGAVINTALDLDKALASIPITPSSVRVVDSSGNVVGIIWQINPGNYFGIVKDGAVVKKGVIAGITPDGAIVFDMKVVSHRSVYLQKLEAIVISKPVFLQKDSRVVVKLVSGAQKIQKVVNWGKDMVVLAGTKVVGGVSKTISILCFTEKAGKVVTTISKITAKAGGKIISAAAVGSMVCDVYTLSKTIEFALEDEAKAVSSGILADNELRMAVTRIDTIYFNEVTKEKEKLINNLEVSQEVKILVSQRYVYLEEIKTDLVKLTNEYYNNKDVKTGSIFTGGQTVSQYTEKEYSEIIAKIESFRQAYIAFSRLLSEP
jgi:hypothetical protein